MSIFKDEFVPNIQGANKTSYAQWKQSNPKEAATWEQFRDALYTYKHGDSLSVPSLATKYGKALVAAGKQHMSVTDIGAEYNPPPPDIPPDPPTWTSSIADGAQVQVGTTWTVTVSPANPDSVEFWVTDVSTNVSTLVKTDTTAPYNYVLNETPGSYILGVCVNYGATRTCFEDRKNITLSTTPPPPVGGGLSAPYFNESFVDLSAPEWYTIQTYYGSGNSPVGTGIQGDPSGRVQLVAAPDGVGRALRFENRQSDPPWPPQMPSTAVQRAQLQATDFATWNTTANTLGLVRYFDFELWLPNTFDYARDWNAFIGLHPSSSTGWGCFNIVMEPYGNPHPHYIQFKLGGGSPAGTTANLRYKNLIQITNADGSIYAPNRNRRIHLRYGGRFAPDNTGWSEAWVDGVNVYPRQSGPTQWADDSGAGSYFKIGPYKNQAPVYPSGATVMYFTRMQIGTTL